MANSRVTVVKEQGKLGLSSENQKPKKTYPETETETEIKTKQTKNKTKQKVSLDYLMAGRKCSKNDGDESKGHRNQLEQAPTGK